MRFFTISRPGRDTYACGLPYSAFTVTRIPVEIAGNLRQRLWSVESWVTTQFPQADQIPVNLQPRNSAKEAPRRSVNRRSFLKNTMVAGAAATVGAGILAKSIPAFANDSSGPAVTNGDIAILRFLAAAEIIESDLWEQYTELGGTQDSEESGVSGGSPLYMSALQILDGDMAQYIHDNTDDEKSHFAFINGFLESVGADPVDLSPFATLPSSKATGARDMGRLTNLMNLNVDTSFWTRYRSATSNPDLDPSFTFGQAGNHRQPNRDPTQR